MARTLLFIAEFTKSKVKTTPANAPTIDIADKLAPTGSLLVSAGSPTQFTNLTGVYVYSYSAADSVDPIGVMRTADTTVDLQDIPCNPIPLSAKGYLEADVLTVNGTGQTARDLGASVLLSSGTGTGQLDFTGGVVKSNLSQILGTASQGTAGYVAPDWSHINAPTTTVGLSGTTVGAATSVTNDVGITQTGADKVWGSVSRTLTAFSFTVAANLTQILGTALTETAGQIAAGVKKFFNVATPTSTMNEITLVDTTTDLTNAGTVDASTVWTYTTRTLTQGAASVVAAVAGSSITVYRGASWSISLTGLGTLTGYSKLWFTVKNELDVPDSRALVQIAKYSSGSGDGLLALGGGPANAALGSITIDDATAGNITILLDEAASAQLTPAVHLSYDVRVLNGGNVAVLADGSRLFTIVSTPTQSYA